jgi:hypothetical protein
MDQIIGKWVFPVETQKKLFPGQNGPLNETIQSITDHTIQ